MAGTFIISFDCEGKWGICDHLNGQNNKTFTNENLVAAYRELLRILEEKEIKATFAFVGAFSMSPDEYHSHQDWFSNELLNKNTQKWLAPFKESVKQKKYEGWLCPEAYDLTLNSPNHEIASHGFSHLPLGENYARKDDFLREMDLVTRCGKLKGNDLKTFVYPRNLIGYRNNLSQFGFSGYRASKPIKSSIPVFRKFDNFMDEIKFSSPGQSHSPKGDFIEIPSGYFLNWRHGFRKQIPLKLTLRKWNNLISHAIENDKVVHLWSHPHNFIDGDNMYYLFEEILDSAAKAIKRGQMENFTQKEYVETRLEQTPDPLTFSPDQISCSPNHIS